MGSYCHPMGWLAGRPANQHLSPVWGCKKGAGSKLSITPTPNKKGGGVWALLTCTAKTYTSSGRCSLMARAYLMPSQSET
jgi:hypothetical protein